MKKELCVSVCICCLFLATYQAQANKIDVQQIQWEHCGLNEFSRILARLIITDPRQNRTRIRCNPILSKVADEKAREMAELKRVTHVGKRGANIRLRDAGYPLAKIYPGMMANNVEAIAGGIKTPETMWIEFKKSAGHRSHLLAEHEFYLLQDEIGVGFYYDWNTPHVEYWVVYFAHQHEESSDTKIAASKD